MQGDLLLRVQRMLRDPAPASSDFDLNPDVGFSPEVGLRSAAVLVGLRAVRGETQVLLTKRSSQLKHHPGQVSFPGGKVEKSDASLEDAALREASEEVGLDLHQATVLGQMSPHTTVTKFLVTPVLCRIDPDFDPQVSDGEVAEAFWVPWSHFADPGAFSVQSRIWAGQERRYYSVPFGPYYIWGATARMLYSISRQVAA